MRETLTLTAEDAHPLSAYRAAPGGQPRGGLVIVQEIFGVNPHIQKTCDGFAADGYVALAPALFEGVAAAVGYYGGGIAAAVEEQPRCPVLLHFGETDASIPPEQYQRVMAAHPAIPVHLYPAGHGFNCDERASYHAPSATLARTRTLEFLRRHIG